MGERQYIRSHCHSWWPPRPPWLTLLLASLLISLAYSSITCGPGIRSAGVTVPGGDIVLEYGNGVPLEITCILDPENEIVKNLFRNDTTDGYGELKKPSQRIIFYKNSDLVPRQYVTIINSTAAKLLIPNPPPGRDMFYCSLLLDNPSRHTDNRDDDSSGAHLYTPSRRDPLTLPTQAPTSLETSGPPSMFSPTSEAGVCLNSVSVGYKPGIITNFSCISDNWVSLTCNWTKPENQIKTTYKLFLRLPGRAGGRTIINCPTDSDSRKNTCYWDSSTTPIYRQPYEYYYLIFIGENILGNSSTTIYFNHYANVIPASPIDITVVDKTHSSAMLRWSVGRMTAFPKELIQKIEYKSQWDSNPEHWHSVHLNDVCNSSLASNQTNSYSNCQERDTDYYFYNITDLKYPFTHYDFRIYVRSSVARGEDKWSPPGCITLKTKPTIPKRPPRTDIGSFECVTSPVNKSKRDIFIYWQNIEDNEKHGDSFEYYAFYTSTTADNNTMIHRSNETYKNYAKFEELSTNIGYNFTVYSSNKEGLSSQYSTIYVPSESDKLDEPLSFTKMAFDERGVFELSWKNASSKKLSVDNLLNDYTIFWCENDKDRPYQCNGYMNWMHIPSSESCYNITVSDHMKIYQFAISSNSQNTLKSGITSRYQTTTSSSGMVWASCTVLHNKIVGKLKNVWVNVIGSNNMELIWKLDCSDRIGAVLGFRLFYCPVISINNSSCKEPMLNKTVGGGETLQENIGRTTIEDLKPYTTYMVTIALITKHGEGLHSDPLLNTTLEGAPDIQNLKINVTKLSNTSVSIEWSPPKFPNGVVRYYHINYNLDNTSQQQDLIDSFDEQQAINEQRRITVHDTKGRLDHLESYRSYTISVTACTTICSNRSLPIQVQTAVGVPGKVQQPSLLYENRTVIAVSWVKPTKPAGPVDYYELIVAHHSGPTNSQTTNGGSSPTALASTLLLENPDNAFYHSESNEFHVPVPDCNDEQDRGQQTFTFAVRAVNNNPLDPNKPYYGQWSVPGSVSCVLPGLPLALHLVIWSCLFIVLSTVSTYWGNRLWKKYKIMHNVEVVLPPTLNINFKFDYYNNYGENILDSGQQYCAEEGNIIYDNVPAESNVTTVDVHRADANSSSNPRKNSSANDSADERLPSPRWSPATASTTVTVADDNDSSSSKHQLIMSSSLPKPKSESDSHDHGLKNDKDEVLEVVPPTEPVLPFFSLPPTPTLSAITGHTRKMVPLSGCIVHVGNGFQSSTGNGFQSNTGNGFLSSTGNDFQSSTDNGFLSNTGNGLESSTDNGLQSSTGNGFQSNTGNGFLSSTGNGFQSSTGNGFLSNTGNGLESNTDNGLESSTDNGLESSTGNGLQSSTGNGFQSSTGNGFQSSTGNGSLISTGNGYQNKEKGYQSKEKGYQSSGKGFQGNGYGYKTNSNGYQGSNICQDIAKTRFVGDSRGDGIVATAAVISFVGDQRHNNFRPHQGQESELLPYRVNDKQQSQRQPQQNRYDGYCSKQTMIAVAASSTSDLGKVDSDESTQIQQQRLPLQTPPPTQQQELPSSTPSPTQQQQRQPPPSTPPLTPPPAAQEQQQQPENLPLLQQEQLPLSSSPPSPQHEQQSPPHLSPSAVQQETTPMKLFPSSPANVILDMVTTAATKKRLMHMGGGGRIDYSKPAVIVQQLAVSVDAGCGTYTAQV